VVSSGGQRGAEDNQAEGGDPGGDLRRVEADWVVGGEDPAEQRDDVAAQRGEGDDRGRGTELQAWRGGVEGDDDRDQGR
jgi:hypothetical protein